MTVGLPATAGTSGIAVAVIRDGTGSDGVIGGVTTMMIVLQVAVLLLGLAATLGWQAGRASTAAERRRLREQTGLDPLTELANRAGLARAAAELAALVPAAWPAVLVIDLDGFKAINDVHGHATGDAVLVRAAQRLRECLRGLAVRGSVAARLGGDEFGVLLALPAGAGAGEAARIAAALHQALCRPYCDSGAGGRGPAVSVGASIGVAVGGARELREWERLITAADDAMYMAKRSGGGWSWAGSQIGVGSSRSFCGRTQVGARSGPAPAGGGHRLAAVLGRRLDVGTTDGDLVA